MGMNLGSAIGYLELNTDRWQRGFQTAQSQMRTMIDSSQSMGNRFQAAGQVMQNVGSNMSKFVTLPLTGIGAASVKIAADFESSMSKVRAVTGANGQDMKKLESLAREMGATTKFSASEAADALNYMGMAGWKTQDMMDGLPGVLDLAAAGGTDLSLTSDIVTDGLTGLGLTAKDTGMFVDVMAATMSNSNTNVELMGESLKYVGPVAGALGIDMQDLSLAIGLMGNSGIKGGQAGTALRAGLSNLIKPTDDAAAVMDKYGIEIAKTKDGQVDFMGTMQNLRTHLGGLDETTQAAALSTIFGKESMSGWASIVNASEGDFNKLSDAINNSTGKSKEMAEVMQDNLNGQIDNLKSALEEAAISIGNALLPMIKDLTEWIQKLVDWFNQLSPSMKDIVVKAGGVVAALGPLLMVFGSIARAIGSLSPVFSLLGGMISKLKTAFLILKTLIMNTLIPALSSLWTFMLANPITLVIAAVAALVAGFVYLWNHCDGFKEFWVDLWNNVKEWCSSAVETVINKFNEWGTAISNFVTETIPQFIQGIGEWFAQLPTVIGTWLTTTMTNIGTWCSDTFNAFVTWCSDVITGVGEWFAQLPYKIGFALGFAIGKIAQWISDTWNYFVTNVPIWIESIGEWFAQLPGKIWQWLVSAFQKTTEWGSNMLNKAIEVGTNFLSSIVRFFTQLPGKIWSFLVSAFQKAVQWTSQMVQKAIEAGSQFINNVSSFMQQLPGKVWGFLSQAISKAISFATDFASKGIQAAKDFGSNIVDGLSSIPGKVLDIGKNIVEGLWNGISGAAGWLYGKVSSFATGILDGMKSALGIHSPSRVMRDIVGVNIVKGIGVGIDKEMPTLQRNLEESLGGLSEILGAYVNPNNSDKTFIDKLSEDIEAFAQLCNEVTATYLLNIDSMVQKLNMFLIFINNFIINITNTAIQNIKKMCLIITADVNIMADNAIDAWDRIREAYAEPVEGIIKITTIVDEASGGGEVSRETGRRSRELERNLMSSRVMYENLQALAYSNEIATRTASRSKEDIRQDIKVEIDYDKLAKTIASNSKSSVKIENTYNSPKPASIKELKQQDKIQMRRLGMQFNL
ncbi:phage tail tape measure protein [Romboutsia maritimum]|uniref:Phage tail tape measure protein n=1 Tax=Romboutsia maritimum TaxID=2020948 RepID=A0A371IQX0_9FIRM|nr:phage tail tape measure protein [Romboutsia maritimum]RDY22885.1 phage tail tape measure protein [Romboutsia maritimum]